MSPIAIYSNDKPEHTVISNRFIDEYMADANDAQLKIYLYLLRQFHHMSEVCSDSAPCHTTVGTIADKFNYTEKDVLRALKYWEKKDILQLEYNHQGGLAGIRLCSIPAESSPGLPPRVSLVTTASALQIPGTSGGQSEDASGASSPTKTGRKPAYSADQMDAFKKKETTSQLLFIAESYLGKTLSGSDIQSLFFISEDLGFSFDLLDHLLQYCIGRGKKDFRYIEKVAMSWAEAGIISPEQAEDFSAAYDKSVYTVMKALGKSASPTVRETEYIRKWYQGYGFTSEIILEACQRTVMATDKHRFEYADKILDSWHRDGVRHKEDILKADVSFRRQRKQAPSRTSSSNKFNQFQQNEYDFESLERELLHNKEASFGTHKCSV